MTTTPKFYSQIHTRDDWECLFSDIDKLLVSIFVRNDTTFDDAIDNKIGQNSSKIILDSLLDSGISKNNSLDLKSHLEAMKDNLVKMKPLRLIIAIDLSSKIIREISGLVKQNIEQCTFLDIRIDSTIVGGTILIYEGKYYDQSISSIIQQTIPNIIKRLQQSPQ